MEEKIIYYQDELNDEFANDDIVSKKIDGTYKYIRSPFLHFFCYRMIATPLAFLYLKFKFNHKIVNKKILNPFKKQAYFLYGNHTQQIGDAFIPSMISFPQDAFIIVHANNVSIKGLGKFTPYLGALPLPDDLSASRNFIHALEKRINQKKAIVIYPEAHIWPYYTKIRPFLETSFHYPIKYNLPTFCFVNTYQKRKNHVDIVTYIDGPFYSDKTLSIKEQRTDLRNKIYQRMCELSSNSNIEVIKYIKKENSND